MPNGASRDQLKLPPPPKKRKVGDQANASDDDVIFISSTWQRTYRKAAARAAGKLESFRAMPLDIFLEISSHLTPADLLALSRVSRQFARILMTDRGRHAWMASRRNLEDFPECPADLTEAEYAALVFGKECSGDVGDFSLD